MISWSSLGSEFPGRWILYWLLLPNLGIMLMWPVGGPPMRVGLVLFGLTALALSQLPWRPVKLVALAAMTLAMTVFYVCSMFKIPPLNLGLIGSFFAEVRPLRSPEYLAAGAVLLASLLIAMRGVWHVPRLSRPMHFLFACGAVFGLVNLDAALTARAGDEFGGLPPPGTPFDSAVRQVALEPGAIGSRHVLVVMVEALGVPAGPEERALFAADWDRPEWRGRYEVSHGSTAFFGSTTNGELRELCGSWSHYTSFDFAQADCLPARFRKAGHDTLAIHGFDAGFFGRESWYPRIGFARIVFADELERRGVPKCGGVFPGACDRHVPAIIGRELARAEKPQFIYWLTLNTHLPVVADEELGTDDCRMGPAQWRDAFAALCRLFALHHELADAISELALGPDLPPTDILIVGDHRPPLFDRASRERFDETRVPWIHLRARPFVSAQGGAKTG